MHRIQKQKAQLEPTNGERFIHEFQAFKEKRATEINIEYVSTEHKAMFIILHFHDCVGRESIVVQ